MTPLFKKLHFDKISGIDLIILQNKIANRCIKNAKTDQAKEILVRVMQYLTIEEMKRLHMPGYGPPTPRVDPLISIKKYLSKFI